MVHRVFFSSFSSLPKSKINPGLLIWTCDKQWQARLMIMATGVQFLLGVAWFNNLWLLRKREAERQTRLEREDGLVDVKEKSALSQFRTSDYALAAFILSAPFVFMVGIRLSASRWIHSLTMVTQHETRIETYNLLGARIRRILPNSAIYRDRAHPDRLILDGKWFQMPRGGKLHEPAVLERVYKIRD